MVKYLLILSFFFLSAWEGFGQQVIVNGSSNAALINYFNTSGVSYSTNVTSSSGISSASHIFWFGNSSFGRSRSDLRNFVQNGGILVLSGDCNLSFNIATAQLLNATFGANVGFMNVSVPGSTPSFCNVSGTAFKNASCTNAAASCSRLEYDSTAFPELTRNIDSIAFHGATGILGIPALMTLRHKPASTASISNKLNLVSTVAYGSGWIIIHGDASIFNSSSNQQYFSNIINFPPQDTIPPTVITRDITLALDATGRASLLPAQIDSASFDSSGVASLSVSPNTFDCTNLGLNVVNLMVTDSASNSASGTANVKVVDIVPPQAVARSITVQLDSSGNANIVAADIENGSTDNCGPVSLTLSRQQFNCADAGDTVGVTLQAMDHSGNVGSTSAMVIVLDHNLPDFDKDGIKDPCDRDVDNDGILDTNDKYPFDSTNNGQAVIVSYVWDDLDGDGIQDPNEPPVRGVAVDLLGSWFRFFGRKTSDANGQVAFFDLKRNTRLRLKFKRRPGDAFTYRNRSNNNNLDSDVNQIFGITSAFRLRTTQVISTIDAGIWSPGKVDAFVWDDQNANGIQDTSESGIAGLTVKLLNWRHHVVDQVLTDSLGIAHFDQVAAGRLRKLQFVPAANYQITQRFQGQDRSLDSDASSSNGKSLPFILKKGNGLVSSIDGGLAPVSAQVQNGQPSILAEATANPSKMEMVVYPNPVEAEFTFELKSQQQDQALIIVHNVLGVKVMEEQINIQKGTNVYRFDFSSPQLSKGYYLLNLIPTQMEPQSLKFIKE